MDSLTPEQQKKVQALRDAFSKADPKKIERFPTLYMIVDLMITELEQDGNVSDITLDDSIEQIKKILEDGGQNNEG